jgi:uncharacterized membrane protein YuzA (DUF378 family)
MFNETWLIIFLVIIVIGSLNEGWLGLTGYDIIGGFSQGFARICYIIIGIAAVLFAISWAMKGFDIVVAKK